MLLCSVRVTELGLSAGHRHHRRASRLYSRLYQTMRHCLLPQLPLYYFFFFFLPCCCFILSRPAVWIRTPLPHRVLMASGSGTALWEGGAGGGDVGRGGGRQVLGLVPAAPAAGL